MNEAAIRYTWVPQGFIGNLKRWVERLSQLFVISKASAKSILRMSLLGWEKRTRRIDFPQFGPVHESGRGRYEAGVQKPGHSTEIAAL